jgi:hypothetical protein
MNTIMIHRFPLLCSMTLLMQVSPLPQLKGSSMSPELVQALASSPAYISIIFLVIAFLLNQRQQQKFYTDQQRFQAESAQRRDETISAAFKETRESSDEAAQLMQDEIKQLRTDNAESLKLLAKGVEESNKINKALEERTAYILEDHNKDAAVMASVNTNTNDIKQTVSQILDKFIRVFPNDDSIDARFDRLKVEMIKAIEETCEQRKHDSKPIPVIDPPAELPKASGE